MKILNLGTVIAFSSLAFACGGDQKTPAESPEAASTPESTPPGEAPAEGEHTMPDGTKMEGHHHEEGAPAEAEKKE